MRMRFSEHRGLVSLFVTLLLILGIFTGLVFLTRHVDRRDYAKKYFGVTIEWDLSEEEKELLKPMVASKLKLMKQDYEKAVAESEFFDKKDSITPDTADGLLGEFREAEKQKNSRRTQLELACVIAKYFELADTNLEWCK